MSDAFLAFSHMVPDAGRANRLYPMMLLSHEGLKRYGLKELRHEKRKAINKAVRLGYQVREIEDLRSVFADLKAIAESNAERVEYGLDRSYYEAHFDEWFEELERLFELPGRKWWGAFINGRLVAYLYFYLVDETLILDTTKTHSDFLRDRPSDLLHFEVLKYAQRLPKCQRVSAGAWVPDAEGINRFKEGHGFECVGIPIHVWYNPMIRASVRLLSWIDGVFGRSGQTGHEAAAGWATRRYRRLMNRVRRLEEIRPTRHGDPGGQGTPAA